MVLVRLAVLGAGLSTFDSVYLVVMWDLVCIWTTSPEPYLLLTSAHLMNPSWVALDTSRGIETPGSKAFMRLTVVILDALIYIPGLVMFSRTWQASRSKRTQELVLLTLLFQPALLLIDFGHFQYNSVMLGEHS